MAVLVLIVLVVLLWFYNAFLNLKNKPICFPPGPMRLPIWGSYWLVLKEHYYHPHLAFEKLGKRYNTDILGLYLGDTPCIVPLSYELCREALIKEEFAGRNDTIITRLRGLGGPRGIFFLDGPLWREQRRFTLRNMRDFGFGRRSERVEHFILDEVKYLINLLSNEPKEDDRDFYPVKGNILMPDALYGSLLNSILLIVASTRFDYKDLRNFARNGLIFQQSGDPTGCAVSMTPWLIHIAPKFFGYADAKKSNKKLLKFVQDIITEHKETFSEDHFRDFLDMYINEKKIRESEGDYFSFGDKQLLLTTLDVMFPAAIAVGHTLNFYFSFMVNFPSVQKKVQEEIDSVIGRSRLPNLDDRNSLPYTEASIREGMRFIPLNPLCIPRRCMEDTFFAGHFIPKDTIVLPNVWTAHKDERFWKDPETFLPERFLDKNGVLLKKDYTLGFGAGKRLCAGETFGRHIMFFIVSGLLQNFTVKSPTGRPIDLTNIAPGANLSISNNYLQFVHR